MRCSRYRFLWVFCALALAPAAVDAVGPGDELVRIDGQVITRADLHLTAVPQESPEALHARTARALSGVIERRLVLAKALEQFAGADGAEALLTELGNSELKGLNERLGSQLKTRRYLAELGLTMEQFKRARAEQLLVSKFLSDTVVAAVSVSPAQIRRYYEEHPDQFRLPDRIAYRQIVLVCTSEADKRRRSAEADALLKLLKDGADFGKLADRHSADAKARPGGLRVVELDAANVNWRPPVLKDVAVGKLSGVVQLSEITFAIARLDSVKPKAGAEDVAPDTREPVLWRPPVLKGLKVGETTGVVDRGDRLVIARLENVKPAGPAEFDKVQGVIRDQLRGVLRQAALDRYTARLRETAHVEYLPAGEAFKP